MTLHQVSICLGVASLATAMVLSAPAAVAAQFSDTRGHWAESYIDALSSRGVINGFPDGSFRPNQPVTRAQFATIVSNGFQLAAAVGGAQFTDVSPGYWATSAISTAAANGLVSGFPDRTFRPEQPVTRTETLVVLTNALGSAAVPAAVPVDLSTRYRDAAAIPSWANAQIAAASQAGLVVSYPDPTLLEPNRAATRAEVAASTYQAMVQRGLFGPIAQAPGFGPTPTPGFDLRLATVNAGTPVQAGTTVNERLYIAPNETRPFSLIVLNPVLNPQGEILIPYGAKMDGRFEPAAGGTRFVADSIAINDQVFALAAQSDVIPDIKDPRQVSTGQVVQDAAIGAAAGAILGLVTGDQVIATEEVLAGAAGGAAIGNFTAPRVSVVDPQQPIVLRVTQDLVTAR